MNTLKDVLYKELDVKESFEIPEKLLNKMLSDDKNIFLSEIEKVYNFEEDSLRDFFQTEQSSRKDFMQDYTPDCICKILNGIAPESNNMLDICSGTGALTIDVSKKVKGYLQLEELSSASIPYLLLNLSLRNASGKVYKKDVITKQIFQTYELSKGEKYSNINVINEDNIKEKFELIISNPPYSLSYEIDENDTRIKEYCAPPKSKADYLFILDALERLEENGKAFFILPTGVLFRGSNEGKIRQKLVENNLIEAIIGLPSNLFMNTQIPTIILVLNKNKQDTNILFVDGSTTFEKGKKQNYMSKEQISKFVDVYNNKKAVQYFSTIITKETIETNDFNLNIPRYVEQEHHEKEINLNELLQNFEKIDEEQKKLAEEMKGLMSQLTYRNIDGSVNMEKTEKYLETSFAMIDLFSNNSNLSYMKNIADTYSNLNDDAKKYHYRILTDLVKIERAKKNKVYKAGSIKIQMSATKGQIYYLATDQEVETHYAVMEIIADNLNSYYLYEILKDDVERFLKKYQTGLNITTDIFQYWKVPIHDDIQIQNDFAAALYNINNYIEKEEKAAEWYKDWKDYNLNKMLS